MQNPPMLHPPPVMTAPPVEQMLAAPRFMLPYEAELLVSKRRLSSRRFTVVDVNRTVVFRVRGGGSPLRPGKVRVLTDADGAPLLSLRQQRRSKRKTWKAYWGEGLDQNDVVFTIRRAPLFRVNSVNLNVYLAGNVTEHVPDFHVVADSYGSGCKIYTGYTSMEIGQMYKCSDACQGPIFHRKEYGVIVSPFVDCALVVALSIVHREISMDINKKK